MADYIIWTWIPNRHVLVISAFDRLGYPSFQTLGYPSLQTLKLLVLELNHDMSLDCESCQLAHHRMPYPDWVK